jgi:hypothetical protein
MQAISENLDLLELLKFNALNHHFYDKMVPEIMKQRRINPKIRLDMHLFLKGKKLYGMAISLADQITEIDFEHDDWRHDSQCVINVQPKLLFDFETGFGEGKGLEVKEEIFPHYIIQVSAFKYIVYPLDESIYLTRGFILECVPNQKPSVKKTSPPPV